MEWSLFFVFNSILLGVGLAMDAFSVSLANGLNESWMHKKKNVCHCRNLWFLSGINANDRMGMCSYHY